MPCISGKFKPAPKETLQLPGGRYVIQPHPAAAHMPFSAEGRRAIVYNLEKTGGGSWALKVFKRKYQTPDLMNSAGELRKLSVLPGMLAASRSVVAPADQVAVECPDLSYATLMPWIAGTTWN